MPRVSVCCSVLNQPDYLRDMIGSVYCQSFKDWELIIVDDGSTEDVKSVVDGFKDERIRYIRWDENRGIPWGINHAMSEAKGEFIQPLAADELLTPDKLKEQLEYMDANPGVDCIWGIPQNGNVGARPMWEQNQLRAHNRSQEQWLRTLLNIDNVPIGGASMLARRGVFDELGYFDTNLLTFSDHEWFVRFFEAGKVGRILPFRWALSRPNPKAVSNVQTVDQARYAREVAYVREKHAIPTPDVEPSITVGIAIYNMAHFLPDALDSIFAQTLQPTEIMILDDASTDNVQEVLARYNDPRIKFMRFEENSGNMRAQNAMLAQASGMFYVPFAADDKLDKHHLERCLSVFRQNPWLEFCASQTDFINKAGETITEPKEPFEHGAMGIPKPINQTREKMLAQLYYSNVYFGVGMYRTATLREVGGWDKQYGVLADYEMYLRLLQRETIFVIEEPLTHTRLHDSNLSNLLVNKPGEGKSLTELYKHAKRNYYAPRMKVIIATPFYEMKAWCPYVSSIVATIKILTMLGIEHEFFELSGDSYVARARNTICTKFLEDAEATDLFFIDSDMSWNAEAFVRMLMLPEGVVAASYPTKNMWEQWTSLPILKEEGGRHHPVGRLLQDGSALCAAETVATGFCRIKREVLEDFAKNYPEARYREPGADQSRPDREYIEFFATGREPDGLWYGEDRMFCKRLREMGEQLYIYPNATIGHFGVKGWSGNFDKYLRGKKDGDSTGHRSPGV